MWSGIPSGKEEIYQPADHFYSCLLEAFALFQSDSYRLRNPLARQSLDQIKLLLYPLGILALCVLVMDCHNFKWVKMKKSY